MRKKKKGKQNPRPPGAPAPAHAMAGRRGRTPPLGVFNYTGEIIIN